jgi:hypothetical protein
VYTIAQYVLHDWCLAAYELVQASEGAAGELAAALVVGSVKSSAAPNFASDWDTLPEQNVVGAEGAFTDHAYLLGRWGQTLDKLYHLEPTTALSLMWDTYVCLVTLALHRTLDDSETNTQFLV